MSVLQKLTQSLAKAITAPVGTDPRGWSVVAGRWPGRWTKADDLLVELNHADLAAAWERHPLVNACVTEISTSAAQPRLEFGVDVNGKWRPTPGGDLADLIGRPNADYTRNDLVQLLAGRLSLHGLAYLWKWRARGNKMRLGQLWPVPTAWVRPKLNRSGSPLIAYYETDLQKAPIPPEDMGVFRRPSISSAWEGNSAGRACGGDYALDRERERYLAEMLINLKMPGLVIRSKRNMSPEQKKALKLGLDSAIGQGRRGDALLIEGDTETELMNPLKDLDWPGLSGLLESRICMAFGVPPILVGARIGLDRSTFANYGEARKSFYHETMAPLWEALADGLTKALLRDEGDSRLSIRFRYDELPEFQDDEDAKARRASLLFRSGVISREVAQDIAGVERHTVEAPTPVPVSAPTGTPAA